MNPKKQANQLFEILKKQIIYEEVCRVDFRDKRIKIHPDLVINSDEIELLTPGDIQYITLKEFVFKNIKSEKEYLNLIVELQKIILDLQ